MSSQGQVLSSMSGSTSLERWSVGAVVPPSVVALYTKSIFKMLRRSKLETVRLHECSCGADVDGRDLHRS